MRKKSARAYLAAVVSLLPKQQEKLDSPFSDLTEDELNLLEHFLKSTRAKNITPTIDAQPIADEALVPQAILKSVILRRAHDQRRSRTNHLTRHPR